MNTTLKTDDFLFRYGLHPDSISSEAFIKAFISEMKAGLSGNMSSLMMLPTYLPAAIRPFEGASVVAVDIGGTNLKIASLRFENGQFEILKSVVSPVPGLTEELTADEFFTEVARRILPVIGSAGRIGICFSHAAKLLPNLDGHLISFSKEMKVTHAEGVLIAQTLYNKLISLGMQDKKTYTLLNDSAATLLGGASQLKNFTCDGLIGLVLGTGINLSYIEKQSELKNLEADYSAETMVINTETGNFNALPLGPVDQAFEAGTSDPGSHRLEKMTSGRYLGELVLFVLKKAAEEGLFIGESSLSIMAMPELLTPQAGAILAGRRSESDLDIVCRNENDCAVITTVIDRLFERAAKLSALAVLAVMEKTGAGIKPSNPAVIVTEGSTINKLFSMKARFLRQMQDECAKNKRYFRLIMQDNATLIGTALAAFR